MLRPSFHASRPGFFNLQPALEQELNKKGTEFGGGGFEERLPKMRTEEIEAKASRSMEVSSS